MVHFWKWPGQAAGIILSAAMAATPIAAAAQGDGQPAALEQTEIRYQGWAGQVIWIELADDLGFLAPLQAKWVGNTISGPQDIQAVVTRDTDIGGAFNGAIVKLLSKKAPVTAVIGYYGVDDHTWTGYYVTDDSPIKSVQDLIGKKVAVNTLGAHHEFMVREYLERAGISAQDAKQVSLIVTPPVAAEQSLRSANVDVAQLGGVLRDKALERGGIHPLFTDQDLFGTFTAGSYVLRDDFIAKNPNTTRHLVTALARAIEWARETPPDEVRARYTRIIKERRRAESADAIPYWKSTGVAQPGGLITDDEFQIWINWLVKDGLLQAGQVQPASLYTNEFNPYAGAAGDGARP